MHKLKKTPEDHVSINSVSGNLEQKHHRDWATHVGIYFLNKAQDVVFPIQRGVYSFLYYIWVFPALDLCSDCPYTCTGATSTSLVLPLSDSTFQRPSTQQLKCVSHPFGEMKVGEKSQKATCLIRLVLLKEEQKGFLLHFPLTSMLFRTQEAWRPQWPMSHISSGCGTASCGGWWHSVRGGFYLVVVLDR